MRARSIGSLRRAIASEYLDASMKSYFVIKRDPTIFLTRAESSTNRTVFLSTLPSPKVGSRYDQKRNCNFDAGFFGILENLNLLFYKDFGFGGGAQLCRVYIVPG